MSWPNRRLGDLLKIQNGFAFDSKRFIQAKGMPLIRIRDLKRGGETETKYDGPFDDSYLVRSGDYLIGMDGEFGCFEWRGSDALLNQRVCRLAGFSNQLEPRFVFYGINRYLKEIEEHTTFTTVKHLSSKQIANIEFPLPPPNDQRRIVAILDEAFEAIATATANAEKNLLNAQELTDSASAALFSKPDDNWERLSLESLLERGWITGHLDGNHGSEYPRKEEFIERGVPYISANCIENEAVNFESAKYLSADRADKIRKGIAQDGDILFAHNATVGPVAILKTHEPRIILGTSLTYYRCDPKRINPSYLANYMRSQPFKMQYVQVMRQSTRNQVPITKQREFMHIIPPLDVQQEIGTRLEILGNECSTLKDIYTAKVAQLANVRQAILNRAFSGRLSFLSSGSLEAAAE